MKQNIGLEALSVSPNRDVLLSDWPVIARVDNLNPVGHLVTPLPNPAMQGFLLRTPSQHIRTVAAWQIFKGTTLAGQI